MGVAALDVPHDVPCSQADIAAAKPAGAEGADGSKLNWDVPKEDDDISKMPQHAKVCVVKYTLCTC